MLFCKNAFLAKSLLPKCVLAGKILVCCQNDCWQAMQCLFGKIPVRKMPLCKMPFGKMRLVKCLLLLYHFINQMSDKLALSFANLPFSQGTKNAFNDESGASSVACITNIQGS
jgi:hypothetical protein